MDNGIALPTDKKTTAQKADVNEENTVLNFRVSGIFSSDMVLQGGKPIKIWGISDRNGSTVKGQLGEAYAQTDVKNNSWILEFPIREYSSKPITLTVYDDRKNKAEFTGILIGDVYLIGGQSNAEVTLSRCMLHDIEFDENENFRLFTQTQNYVYTHQQFCTKPQNDIVNPEWKWKKPDKTAGLEFSAVGWYAARKIIKNTDIPLGFIMVCAGGACIRELVPEEIAHKLGYTYGANVRESGYYNTLISPFVGLCFRAMIFFQGESEGIERQLAERYAYELTELVKDERYRFGFEFQFYNIQLSSYRKEGAEVFRFTDIVRLQQFDALKTISNSTLTVDMDLGSPEGWDDWAHSPLKEELGNRIADLISFREYGIGKEEDISSPIPVSAVLDADRRSITVKFKNVSSGLCAYGYNAEQSIGMNISGFSFGTRENQKSGKAVITDKNTVTVQIPENADISHIYYAFKNIITHENANLYNSAGLPAPAFCTDTEF